MSSREATVEEDLDGVTHLECVEVFELILVDEAFRLETDIDDCVVAGLADDRALQNLSASEVLLYFAGHQAFHVAVCDLVAK